MSDLSPEDLRFTAEALDKDATHVGVADELRWSADEIERLQRRADYARVLADVVSLLPPETLRAHAERHGYTLEDVREARKAIEEHTDD